MHVSHVGKDLKIMLYRLLLLSSYKKEKQS